MTVLSDRMADLLEQARNAATTEEATKLRKQVLETFLDAHPEKRKVHDLYRETCTPKSRIAALTPTTITLYEDEVSLWKSK